MRTLFNRLKNPPDADAEFQAEQRRLAQKLGDHAVYGTDIFEGESLSPKQQLELRFKELTAPITQKLLKDPTEEKQRLIQTLESLPKGLTVNLIENVLIDRSNHPGERSDWNIHREIGIAANVESPHPDDTELWQISGLMLEISATLDSQKRKEYPF